MVAVNSNSNLYNFRRVGIKAVKEAGKILKKDFYKKKTFSIKKDLSLVTEADLGSEQIILNVLKSAFPDHDILSEESGGRIGGNYTWLVDPLDGTTNFIRGVPFFSVSIAFLIKNKPILGIVFNPITNELYWAQRHKGAYLNNQRIKVNNTRAIDKTIVLFNKGRGFKNFISWIKIMQKIGGKVQTVRVLGSANLESCQVATGRLEGYLNIGSHIWDQVPGAFIVEEAGGKITDIKGNAFNLKCINLLATNKFIHNKLLNLMK